MKKHQKEIWLIDDSAASNLLNQKLFNQLDPKLRVKTFTIAEDALNSFRGAKDEVSTIFLDLNMPAMDGWDFIEEFKAMKQNSTIKTRLILLSTSMNPKDKKRASADDAIEEYLQKPLEVYQIKELLSY